MLTILKDKLSSLLVMYSTYNILRSSFRLNIDIETKEVFLWNFCNVEWILSNLILSVTDQ